MLCASGQERRRSGLIISVPARTNAMRPPSEFADRLQAGAPRERPIAGVGATLPKQRCDQILEAPGLVTQHLPQSVPGFQRAGLEHFGGKSAIPTRSRPLRSDNARWARK